MSALVQSHAAKALQDGEWDPYVILGLVAPATVKQIRDAYRRLAKAVHGDAGGDDAAFLALKEAHDFLLDPVSRELWDRQKIRATNEMRQRSTETLKALCELVVHNIINGNQPPEYADIPKMMRTELRKQLEELARIENQTKREKRQLHLLEGRVRRKSSGENLVAVVISRRIAAADDRLVKVADETLLGRVMLAEMDSYQADIPDAYDMSSRTDTSSRYFYPNLGSSWL